MTVLSASSALTTVLDAARGELGRCESPPGSNRNPYAAEAGHADGQAWCATFVVAMMRRGGVHLPSESAYTPTMANGFRGVGRWTSAPQPGAVVFFQWPGQDRICHVGIVEALLGGGSIATIEGNTDSAGGGSGGRVMRQRRRTCIAGYGLPDYGGAASAVPPPRTSVESDEMDLLPVLQQGATGQPVRNLQGLLCAAGRTVDIDGEFGPGTDAALRAWQAAVQAPGGVDGVAGAGTWGRLLGLR
jgi:hypothetical protein